LAINWGGVYYAIIEFQQKRQRYPGGVISDFYRLCMASTLTAHLLVSGIRRLAIGISNLGGNYARD